MSASSATTLISPPSTSANPVTENTSATAPAASTSTNQPTTQTSMQRSNSHHGQTHKARHAHTSHGAHHGHGHHGKRRPSAHAAHTTGHLTGGRRGSESDGGRKVAFAALTMAAMNHGEEKGKRRKSQEEVRWTSSLISGLGSVIQVADKTLETAGDVFQIRYSPTSLIPNYVCDLQYLFTTRDPTSSEGEGIGEQCGRRRRRGPGS